ncbi:MAG: tetratricopeptide repeat protein [Nitrospinota bacterium]|nr:tetratricopeptide repeat protein [Nitrospinota bacterium]
MRAEIRESRLKGRQAKIDEAQKFASSTKNFQDQKFQISRKIKDIREFIALGNFAEAAELAEKVLKMDSENAKAYTWWGISLVKTKQLDQAIKKFLKSSRLDPGQPRTFLYWGLTLSMQKKYEEAITKYKKAIQLDPENSSAYAYWGGALTSIGNDKEAAIQLQKSLDINPFNETAYDPLVNSFYNMGQYKEAWRTVFKARNLNVNLSGKMVERLSRAMAEPESKKDPFP